MVPFTVTIGDDAAPEFRSIATRMQLDGNYVALAIQTTEGAGRDVVQVVPEVCSVGLPALTCEEPGLD